MIEVGRYPYFDEHGRLLYWQVRFEPKSFRPLMADGETWGLTCQRVLYRLPDVANDIIHSTVWITEGEKDADRLADFGYVSTTTGSASSWRATDTDILRKAYRVVVVPDCDPAGSVYADAITTELYPNHHSMKVLDLGGDKGYDLSDFLDENTHHDLEALLWATAAWSPKRKRRKRVRVRGHRRKGQTGLPYNVEDVVWALNGHLYNRRNGIAYCPAHDDEGSTMGLSLYGPEEDVTLVYCHSNCDWLSIRNAIRTVMKGSDGTAS